MRYELGHNLEGWVKQQLGLAHDYYEDNLSWVVYTVAHQQAVVSLCKALPRAGSLYSDKELSEAQCAIDASYARIGEWLKKRHYNKEEIEGLLVWMERLLREKSFSVRTFSEMQSIRQRALNIMRMCGEQDKISGWGIVKTLSYPTVFHDQGFHGASLTRKEAYEMAMELNVLAKNEMVARMRSKRRIWRIGK